MLIVREAYSLTACGLVVAMAPSAMGPKSGMTEGWPHAGVSVHMAGASTFWGLFSSPDAPGDHPWKAYTDQTENSVDFMLRNIQRRGSSNHTVFSLGFT